MCSFIEKGNTRRRRKTNFPPCCVHFAKVLHDLYSLWVSVHNSEHGGVMQFSNRLSTVYSYAILSMLTVNKHYLRHLHPFGMTYICRCSTNWTEPPVKLACVATVWDHETCTEAMQTILEDSESWQACICSYSAECRRVTVVFYLM